MKKQGFQEAEADGGRTGSLSLLQAPADLVYKYLLFSTCPDTMLQKQCFMKDDCEKKDEILYLLTSHYAKFFFNFFNHTCNTDRKRENRQEYSNTPNNDLAPSSFYASPWFPLIFHCVTHTNDS